MVQATDHKLAKCPRCHADVLNHWDDCSACGVVLSGPDQHTSASTYPWYHRGHLVAVIVGLVVAGLGLILPWVTLTAPFIGQVTGTGFDNPHGKIVGGALLVLGGLLYREATQPNRWVVAALGLILFAGLGLIGWDYVDITNRINDAEAILARNESVDATLFSGSVGAGIYLAFGGFAAAFVAICCRAGIHTS